jgi:hypothetical protein
VFGSVQTGSVAKRLNRLLMDIPTVQQSTPSLTRETAEPATAASNSLSPARSSGPSNSSVLQGLPGAQSSSHSTTYDFDSNASDAGNSEDYPTVDALEKQILGHTEENLPLPQRLNNLEQKAFGKPGDSTDDLALRVDRLKNYERSQGGGEEYLAQSPPAFSSSQPVQTLSVTAKLDLIEKVVFAKTYPKDGVVSRLNRLEKAVFPSKPIETFASVPARVNRLMTSLQINEAGDADRLAQNGFTSAPIFADQNSGRAMSMHGQTHHSFLHKVGKIASLIGESAFMSMAGGGMYGGGYPYGGGMNGGMYGGGMSPYGYNRGLMF